MPKKTSPTYRCYPHEQLVVTEWRTLPEKDYFGDHWREGFVKQLSTWCRYSTNTGALLLPCGHWHTNWRNA